MPELLILGAIYTISGIVHGLVGFAFAVVSVPIISLLYSPAVAVGITVVIGPMLMLYNTWLHRNLVAFRRIVPLMLVGLVFIPVGALFLRRTPEALIMITLGAVVIVLTLFTAFAAERTSKFVGLPGVGYGFSILAGFIAGAFVSGGPPIVAYLYNTDSDRMRAKANTQLFFLIFGTAALVTHLVAGTVTADRALRALPFIPVSLVSVRLGAYIASKLSTPVFRWVTDIGLVGLGVYLIATHM